MLLNQAKKNTYLLIKKINVEEKDKLRLFELGLIVGTKILIKHKSVLKNNLLIIFNHSCFVLSTEIAKNIEVNYA